MELHGETYLFNLSLIAVTFTAVSVLVMLIRQVMGGKLSNFDIHLITTYLSYGFVLSLLALLPPLIALFDPGPVVLWSISSALAAAIFTPVLAGIVARRKKVSSQVIPFTVRSSFVVHGLAILLLLLNAVALPWQGLHLYATALTLSLATLMLTFVRRIASLFGGTTGEGWDPKRG
jgi:hypothetical protein